MARFFFQISSCQFLNNRIYFETLGQVVWGLYNICNPCLTSCCKVYMYCSGLTFFFECSTQREGKGGFLFCTVILLFCNLWYCLS